MGAPPTSSGGPERGRPFRAVGVGDRLGRYELVEELGQGGMASVFCARDAELRRDVAVKVLYPHMGRRDAVVARFTREARTIAALDHPHILKVFDVGGGGGEDPPYIVMELVTGGSLQDFLAGSGAPLGEIAACMGIALCDALAAAHAAGIVHRDVKPANVMIAGGGRLVLTDFGVAHVTEGDSLVTEEGAVLGTPAFMSPEQAMGGTPDARSDLYSLGATLYALATGARPFEGPVPKVLAAVANGKAVPPLSRNPRMGGDLARVIERLMAREPGQRYADAAEARAALAAVVATAGLGEPRAELAAYFAGPGEFNAERAPRIIDATLAAARAAADSGSYARALALADRVLALEPEHAEALSLVDRLGTRSAPRRWLPWTGAATILAATTAVILLWPPTPATEVSETPVTDAAPALTEVSETPALTEVSETPVIDAAPMIFDASPSPRRGEGQGGGRKPRRPIDAAPHRLTEVSETPVSLPDAAPPPPPPPPEPAQLTLRFDVWCNLEIDGRAVGGATPTHGPLELAPGTHELRCSQGPRGRSWSDSVTLAAGERKTLEPRLLGTAVVRVDVEGEGVRVGGTFVRAGGSLEVQPGRVVLELIRGGKPVAKRHADIPAAGCTVRDDPELDCYR